MSIKILIAEDEIDIIDLLKLYLEKEDFEIITASNGEDAWDIIENEEINLAILDIMMPKLNGFQLTKKIREKYTFPIIILSAKQMDVDKILGLDLGADDYISKPFNPLEVVARIRAQLRRMYNLNNSTLKNYNTDRLKVGELTLDIKNFMLNKNNEEIILTPTEYKIIHLFMSTPGRVYTKSQIFENISGDKSRDINVGTGLGLSIAKQIVEKHSGEINLIHSNENNFYTEFEIKLPKY